MKKKLFIFVLVILSLSFISAAQHDDYPGFSEKYFDINGNTLTTSDKLIYQTGYYSINGANWVPFTLQGDQYENYPFLLDGGQANLPSALSSTGTHFIIVFSCSLVNNAWDCHGDNGGAKWQLEVITNHVNDLDTSPTGTPVSIHGQLRVQGNQIVDQYGNPYALQGMGLDNYGWWLQYWNSDVITWLRDDWKANAIRPAIILSSYPNVPGALDDPDLAINKAKEIIDDAIGSGIYVVINWHAFSIYPEETSAFFTELAQTYGEYPNVIYEISNEPDYESWTEMKNHYLDIIEDIRAIDPDNIILVSPTSWASDIQISAEDPITGYNNIGYTFHFYADSDAGSDRSNVDYARSKGLAVVVTECGGMDSSGDGPINYGSWNAWVDWMDSNGIGRFMWVINSPDSSCGVLKSSASTSGEWSTFDLTEWGNVCRDYLRNTAE